MYGQNTLLLFSQPVMSNSLQPHGLQHVRPLCPSSSSEVCPSSCPLNQWYHPAISSSDMLFSFCPQSFPASGTFPMSQLFADDWNTGASVSILPMSIQGWFPLRLTDLLSLLSKDSQESSLAPQLKGINSLVLCLLYGPALTTVCDHWEDHSLDYTDLCQQSFVSALHEKWHKSSGFRVFMENISKAAALPHARCGFLWQQES